ncbi:hypothetical protein [Nocardioides sp. SYSU D00065]|uniref:hypothetical protein n=1 Tax=Nocardioides sp. SYSU D00065 TaxID=2817378 RepID=UPI001B3329CD|nr:hypothetical protein [Nocardioides sp. SYSU D00065]
MVTPADLMDLQGRLMDRYNSGSWGSGFPDDPSQFGSCFNNFADVPDPSQFGQHTDALLETMTLLAPTGFDTGTSDGSGNPVTGNANTALDQVSTAGIELDDWTGQAADGFFQWSQSWKTGISNQFAAAAVLRQLLHAEAAVWTAALEDLEKLGNDAYAALEAADDEFDTGAGEISTTLKVVGAVVAVAAAVPTGGASLSILAAVGAGVTVASTGMDVYAAGQTESKKFATCCPRDVLADLMDGVRRVEDAVRDAEDAIRAQLDTNLAEIDGNWDEFCQPPPTLTSVHRNHIAAYSGLGTWGGGS